jgi:hypothetical protein
MYALSVISISRTTNVHFLGQEFITRFSHSGLSRSMPTGRDLRIIALALNEQR